MGPFSHFHRNSSFKLDMCKINFSEFKAHQEQTWSSISRHPHSFILSGSIVKNTKLSHTFLKPIIQHRPQSVFAAAPRSSSALSDGWWSCLFYQVVCSCFISYYKTWNIKDNAFIVFFKIYLQSMSTLNRKWKFKLQNAL